MQIAAAMPIFGVNKERYDMPFTRLALILAYVITAAGLTVFLGAQLKPNGQAAQAIPVLLPLAMIAGLVIRALHKRLDRDDA